MERAQNRHDTEKRIRAPSRPHEDTEPLESRPNKTMESHETLHTRYDIMLRVFDLPRIESKEVVCALVGSSGA